jgi:hypothetical protein
LRNGKKRNPSLPLVLCSHWFVLFNI